MNIRMLTGAALIVLGGFLFMNRGQQFDIGMIFAYWWPSIFIVPVGLFFHWLYFSMLHRKWSGLLIPGGIIFTVGVVCQISVITDGWAYMWPGFILAVAIGLFEFYWFGPRNKYLLIPICIIGGISLLFMAIFMLGKLVNEVANQPWLAIVMIFIGIVVLLSSRESTEK